MVQSFLTTPTRTAKPRDHGLTCLVDNGVPTRYFVDVLESSAHLIDVVKFGWCTALVTLDLEKKIQSLVEHGVQYYFGGTLFEKALAQKKLDAFYSFLKRHDCQIVEISSGAYPLSSKEKGRHISEFSREFYVLSEIGKKDVHEADRMPISQWLAEIHADLDAGARRVILGAGGAGQSGICDADGQLRADLVESISNAGVRVEDTLWEAPTAAIQASLVSRLGPNVNLGNIPFGDVIMLETLRQGTCIETFSLYDSAGGKFIDPHGGRGRASVVAERRRRMDGFVHGELPENKRLMPGMMLSK